MRMGDLLSGDLCRLVKIAGFARCLPLFPSTGAGMRLPEVEGLGEGWNACGVPWPVSAASSWDVSGLSC
jgi:hypothetical protein